MRVIEHVPSGPTPEAAARAAGLCPQTMPKGSVNLVAAPLNQAST